MIASAGVVLGEKTGWFGSAKLRYFGPRPLIEDDSVALAPDAWWSMAASAIASTTAGACSSTRFNLFNTTTNQIEYYYKSRLRGEAACRSPIATSIRSSRSRCG